MLFDPWGHLVDIYHRHYYWGAAFQLEEQNQTQRLRSVREQFLSGIRSDHTTARTVKGVSLCYLIYHADDFQFMRKFINFVENIFQRLRNASEENSRMLHQLGGKREGQRVRLMGQTSAKWERERETRRESERDSQLVSCRSAVIFHNFHTWRGNKAARKTKYNKTYDFRLSVQRRQ